MAKVIISTRKRKKTYIVSERVAQAIDILIVNDDKKSWNVETNSCEECERQIKADLLNDLEKMCELMCGTVEED